MGKDLKGKELGKGLGQRKDKYYYAKYSYHGKKGQQSFHTLVEAKNWRQEQLYLCRHPELRTATSPDMTVDAWFNRWLKDVVGNRAPNTLRIIVNATNIMFSRLSVLCCCEMSNLWTAR